MTMASINIKALTARIDKWGDKQSVSNAEGILLIGDCIAVALEHGNIDPMKRLAAFLSGDYAKAALHVFVHFVPAYVKDGGVAMAKGWVKAKAKYPSFDREMHRLQPKGFYDFAALLGHEKPAKAPAKPMDTDAFLAKLAALAAKALDGAADPELVKRVMAVAELAAKDKPAAAKANVVPMKMIAAE